MAKKSSKLAICTADGYRNLMVNAWGGLTRIDDEEAKLMYENPAFRLQVYDAVKKIHVPPSAMQWADENGNPTTLVVGKPYEKVVMAPEVVEK